MDEQVAWLPMVTNVFWSKFRLELPEQSPDIGFMLQHFKYLDFMQVTVRDKLIQREFILLLKDYYFSSIYRNPDGLA